MPLREGLSWFVARLESATRLRGLIGFLGPVRLSLAASLMANHHLGGLGGSAGKLTTYETRGGFNDRRRARSGESLEPCVPLGTRWPPSALASRCQLRAYSPDPSVAPQPSDSLLQGYFDRCFRFMRNRAELRGSERAFWAPGTFHVARMRQDTRRAPRFSGRRRVRVSALASGLGFGSGYP